MRNITITAIATPFVCASSVGCAQLSAEQDELAHVHWLYGIKEIVRTGDFSDYKNVASKLNLTLEIQPPSQVKDLKDVITGEDFEVETVPRVNSSLRQKIRFRYGIYVPNDQSYRRVIILVRNIALHECITESELFKEFGYVRRTTYAHAPVYSVNYHFKGANDIELIFRFDGLDAKCTNEINIFQV
ncbi:hypothetical protein [Paraburkholderia fynbosensis]|uniref:Lipoprotein n=1 Tax=Paraburkholderia fynbosensis TaxID=1200993 RepID=A0A6J5GF45_9BURK|nr:hypothetical protein [Paraburkholderia fynbosensis]CAB3799655.1 hypothetical protein LMG27177_04685 [Paraburkholderia fynbosensis]